MKSCSSGRAIELRDGDGELAIRFPFDVALVALARTLPGRRFDQLGKCWCCPSGAVVAVVDTLLPHGFDAEPEVRALYVTAGGKLPFPAPPPPRSCPAS